MLLTQAFPPYFAPTLALHPAKNYAEFWSPKVFSQPGENPTEVPYVNWATVIVHPGIFGFQKIINSRKIQSLSGLFFRGWKIVRVGV